jgi:hypothetical protein
MDIKKTKEIEKLKKEKKKLIEEYSDILEEKRIESIKKATDDFKIFFKEEEFELKSDNEFIHNAIYGDSIVKLSIHDPKKPLIGCQARMDLLINLTGHEKKEYIIPINFKGKRPTIRVSVDQNKNRKNVDKDIKNNIEKKIEELEGKISNKGKLKFDYGLVEDIEGNENPLLKKYPLYEDFKGLLEEIFN